MKSILNLLIVVLIISLSSCSDDSKDVKKAVPSSDTRILSFKLYLDPPLTDYTLVGVVDTVTKKISLSVPMQDTYVTSAKAKIELSSQKAKISPDPAEARDYLNPVVFTVTAEDGTTAQYTVQSARAILKITSLNKTQFECLDFIEITGENFVPEVRVSILDSLGVKTVVNGFGTIFVSNSLVKLQIPYLTEIGNYKVRVELGLTNQNYSSEVNIRVDYTDKTSSIDVADFRKTLNNFLNPPAYQFSCEIYGRFIGPKTTSEMSDIKIYLIDAVGSQPELLIGDGVTPPNNGGVSTSSTYFVLYFRFPNTVFPGKYYLEIDFRGKRTRYKDSFSYPW